MAVEPCEARVFLLKLGNETDADITSFISYLNPAEIQRYQQFSRPERQRQFLMGRMLLRSSLSQLLNISIKKLYFLEETGRAPRLVFPVIPMLGLSISHSGSWVACAVSQCTSLGLDIERIDRQRNVFDLAQQVFNDEEMACFNQQASSDRAPYFYQMWCQKEAHCKLNTANDEPVYFKHFDHSDLSISLCSLKELSYKTTLIEMNSLSLCI